MDKQSWISRVKANGMELQHAPDPIKNDFDVVMEAVTQNGYAIQYVGRDIQASYDGFKPIVMKAVTTRPTPEEKNMSVFYGISEYYPIMNQRRYKQDKDVIYAALDGSLDILLLKPVLLENNRDILIKAVSRYDDAVERFKDIIPALCDDDEIMLVAVEKNGLNLQYASPRLKRDPKMIFAACSINVVPLQFVSEEVKRGVLTDYVRKVLTDEKGKQTFYLGSLSHRKREGNLPRLNVQGAKLLKKGIADFVSQDSQKYVDTAKRIAIELGISAAAPTPAAPAEMSYLNPFQPMCDAASAAAGSCPIQGGKTKRKVKRKSKRKSRK